MPPKQKKAPAKKSKAVEPAGSSKNTDSGLANVLFEEDSWRACVSLVVGSGPAEEALSRCLISAVQQPIRRHFALLTWDGVLDKLCEFGNVKGKKVETLPPFYEHSAVAESAKALLDAAQDVPCELLAKVVKCLLLQLKRQDQQNRQSQQVKCQDSKAEEDDVDTETSEKKTKLKRRGHVAVATVMDRPEDGPQLYVLLCGFYRPLLIAALDAVGVHVSTVIRLCSEDSERQERCQGDGQPAETEAEAELARKLDLFWSELVPVLNSGSAKSRLPDVVQLSYTVQIHSPEAELETGIRIFGGVANLLYDCLEWRRQHQHYLNNIRLIEVPDWPRLPPQQAEVHTPCVGLQVEPGQNRTSGDGASPAAGREDGLKKAAPATPRSKKKADSEEAAPQLKAEELVPPAEVDMRRYRNLLDQVPPESCSVGLILHCMLEQVLTSSQSSPEPSERPAASWLDDAVTVFMLRRFLPQSSSPEERSSMLRRLLPPGPSAADRKRLREMFEAGPAQKNGEQPLIIRHHDDSARRFRGVDAAEEFSPERVEQAMARLHPLCRSTQFRGQRGEGAPCWRSIRQHLRHHCADDAASWPEVQRFLHRSVFESMPLTTPDPDGVLQRRPALLGPAAPVLPWDDPPSFADLQLKNKRAQGQTCAAEDPDNTEVAPGRGPELELADIQSCRLRCLSAWCFTEQHEAAVLSQVLQAAWDQFCCLDTFTGRLNNIVYVFCHDPTGPQRHSKEFWEVGLHTDVRFRNYLEHVADTISDWTREEEEKREAAKVQHLCPAEDLQTQEKEEPIIREGSLKAWKLEQEQLQQDEEKSKKPKNGPKGKQQQEAGKQADSKKSNLSAGHKRGTANVEKGPEAAPPVGQSAELHPGEEPVSSFIGLSTGGMLIRVSGGVQHLRPADGGVVTVENIRYVEASQLLKVVVRKDGHRFCTHIDRDGAARVQLENPEQQSSECLIRREVKLGSFTALLHSGVQMSYSFYGPTGQSPGDVPGTPPRTSAADLGPLSSETHGDIRPSESQRSQHPFSGLNLSVPNGLLVQFRREVAQGVSPQHQGVAVKQCFPLHGAGTAAPLPDLFLSEETFRIITSTGDVIRALRDGSTQVLFADGSVRSSSDSAPACDPDPEVVKGSKEPDQKAEELSSAATPTQRGSWITTTPRGERTHTGGSTHKRLADLLVIEATDPGTDEVMLTREDQVVMVQKPDGSQAVEHADGTRITTWYQDRPADAPAASVKQTEKTTPTSGGELTPSPTPSPTPGPTPGPTQDSVPSEDFKKSEEDVSQPGDGGTTQSNREKVVSVEKEGCATVLMIPERGVAQVVLADGSVVTGTSQGTFEVSPSNGGQLKIHGDGTCAYTSSGPAGGATVYRMSHTHRVACDITDPQGNHFQVTENGDSSVCLGSREQEAVQEQQSQQEHLPRLFLVHVDGSGLELLSSPTVEEEFHQARSDPAVALLKEPLPDSGGFGITVLRPARRSLWSQWTVGKRLPEIAPPNLRNRSWADFPRTENKTPGPGFGTTFGKEASGAPRRPIRSCPDVLEMRELCEHRPLGSVDRDALDARLMEYIEALMSRTQRLEEMEVKEPGAALETLGTTEASWPSAAAGPAFARTPSEVAALYDQGLAAAQRHGGARDASSRAAAGRTSGWPERLRRHRQELSQHQTLRAALRDKSFVPYFHPENLPLYQNLVQPTPSAEPSPVRRSETSGVFLPQQSCESRGRDSGYGLLFRPAFDLRLFSAAPRPSIPAPPQSDSGTAGSDRKCERSLSDAATQTSGLVNGAGGFLSAPACPSVGASSPHYKSVYVDVTGKPRSTRVRLPASVLSSAGHFEPNQKFLTVEEPVKRRCRPVSLSRAQGALRSFQLFPSTVDFGTLAEGSSASVTVRMKNVGVDLCRFQVKQPPLKTGLRVLYTPGPVPAGLHVDLQLQLLATAADASGASQTRIHHDLLIQTELEILYLPVTATICLQAPSDQEALPFRT
ncbi:sperm-associated antigen 17 isoform X3 [Takifugu rubripes]|uniref:sperm-associated antigen 17 isoform X3 n=1 Tax=Takifugu rubripes TaxID=31033 RepID=UPI001145BBFC|nr:sperm-associated antigen 17 isoform X3 [Takifugu rubripes]